MSEFHTLREYVRKGMAQRAAEYILEVQDEALEERFARVNRVRGGKIQRRKKVATKDGYTTKGDKIVRMSAAERRKRSLSQKKGARKRKAKLSTSIRKRKMSLRKRERIA